MLYLASQQSLFGVVTVGLKSVVSCLGGLGQEPAVDPERFSGGLLLYGMAPGPHHKYRSSPEEHFPAPAPSLGS